MLDSYLGLVIYAYLFKPMWTIYYFTARYRGLVDNLSKLIYGLYFPMYLGGRGGTCDLSSCSAVKALFIQGFYIGLCYTGLMQAI